MKMKELREMSDEQVVLTIHESEQNLFRLRMQAQKHTLDAPTELQRHRRLIARLKTLQSERKTKAAAK